MPLTLKKIITYVLLLLVIFIAIFPAIWMLSTSIKPVTELYDNPPEIIPDGPTLANYATVLSRSVMLQSFGNSVVITAAVVVLTLLLTSLAGYGLARYTFRGSKTLSLAFLFGQMVPSVVLVIPLYFMFNKFGLLDTKFGLIIADLSMTLPMGIVMLTSFFKTVPEELEEAAMIDGTTELEALFRVVMPIAKPGLISVAIYTFIHAWEEFLFALNLTLSASQRTLPIAISTFAGEFTVDWGATMAASTVVALPVLAIFLLCNKYFIQGLSDGAVKG